MNKNIILTLLALVAMAGHGQELKIDGQRESQIKKVAATPEDFMEHMALCGYEVYTYDISSLRDSVSGFTIVIREYNQQGMIDEKKLYGFRTKTMISDFNEKDQQEIYAENDADDMERGIYRLAKTLAVGFSTETPPFCLLRECTAEPTLLCSPWKLTLKPIPGAPQTITAIRKRHTSPLRSPLTPSFPLSSTALSGGMSKQKDGVSVERPN